jgi:hypothetical protein
MLRGESRRVVVRAGPLIKRQYFGWLKNNRFYLSAYPPDAPVRPSIQFETVDEVKALLSSQRRIEILWSPPLPDALHAEIEKDLRLEGRG